MRYTRSIKFRLTVWYLVILVALLIILAAAAYLILSNSLYDDLDDSLVRGAAQLDNYLEIENGIIAFGKGSEFTLADQSLDLALIYDDHGVLIKSLGLSADIPQIGTLQEQVLSGRSLFVTSTTANGQEIRSYAAPVTDEASTHGVMVVGRSTAGVSVVLEKLRYILSFVILATVALAGGGGLFLAKRALKPVEQITRAATEIGESDLSRRIEVSSEDELGRLASTLNQMIARLEAAFGRQLQFTADASHELRTPLAVIQAESTLSLRKKRSDSDYRKSLELISVEAAHMSALVDELLFLARSDTGKEHLNLVEVKLKTLIADLVSETAPLCQEKGLECKFGPLENLVVSGDKVELRRLFFNLLDNAMRYTPRGGTISVSLVRKEGTAVAVVRDSGIGISEEHIPHIFERFHRVDKARSRDEGGAGLGLSICQHIAQIHGGRIEVESQPGQGSTFSIFLPLLQGQSGVFSADDSGKI
jgi:heavy metal sensor kinase